MSKQSNQRYRKEKEQEHFNKAGIDKNESDLPGNMKMVNKALDEYDNRGPAIRKSNGS